ncbi:hypothetical protein PCC7424_0434 [Gloeothece citriformis PCC 7424]|uniref:Uncharacterized protein n=1 Tax=Gloeothece citriformis (strain PCC 7424) TaxID=65393 RepID=B7KD80_GLOC7|nr:hypothetical protein [Gloeothece citriformis]ACK68900.1 hypothetical protein PCC7424_0434 [Gloeothece citriformis PCC 7424]
MASSDNISREHHISQESFDLANKHAKSSLKHGKQLEELGKGLQQRGRNQGKIIENQGKKVQEHAKDSLQILKKAEYEQEEGLGGTETFTSVAKEHIKQTQAQVKGVKEFGQVVTEQIKLSKELMNDNKSDQPK